MPKNESAERPPLQTVPGQRDGENKKELLAVRKQPRARPALLWLRRGGGWETSIADAIEAIANVISIKDEVDIDGE